MYYQFNRKRRYNDVENADEPPDAAPNQICVATANSLKEAGADSVNVDCFDYTEVQYSDILKESLDNPTRVADMHSRTYASLHDETMKQLETRLHRYDRIELDAARSSYSQGGADESSLDPGYSHINLSRKSAIKKIIEVNQSYNRLKTNSSTSISTGENCDYESGTVGNRAEQQTILRKDNEGTL